MVTPRECLASISHKIMITAVEFTWRIQSCSHVHAECSQQMHTSSLYL